MHTNLQKGSILGETYLLVDVIGRGGMGDVWRAQHTRLPRQVAVKILHGAAMANETVIARFRREAEIASRLGHGNIVEVFDFNVLADGTPYMVMELLEGQSLRERITQGPLSLGETIGVLRQIASALQEAHDQGIVHRDLKPDNIFLCKETIGDQVLDRIKILDFGISKIRGSQTMLTQNAEVLGTPLYMAPEQAAGQHDKIDGRTDQFAMGAISYELLTGEMAFAGHTLAEVVNKIINGAPRPLGEVVANVPDHVSQAIDRAISKNIDDRFPTIVDFVNTLAGSVASAAVTPPDSGQADTPGAGDAFAATMDSQRLSQPPMPKQASVGASRTSDAVSGFDRTAGGPAGPLTGPSLTTRASAGPPDGARKGPRWGLIVGATIAVLAAVAGGVFAVGALRDRDGKTTVTTAPDAGLAPDSAAVQVTPDAAAPVDSTALSDAGSAAAQTDSATLETDATAATPDSGHDLRTPRTKGRTKRGTRTPPRPRPSKLPPEVAEDLTNAKKALARGAYDEAYSLARRTLTRKRTTQAFSIMARVHCMKRDLRLSKAMLRQLRGAQQRRAIAWCRRHGFDPAPR